VVRSGSQHIADDVMPTSAIVNVNGRRVVRRQGRGCAGARCYRAVIAAPGKLVAKYGV